jgi:hypothetical protein
MEKIYIVTAGDSFTDSHMPYVTTDKTDTFYGVRDKLNNPKELCRPDYSFKYPYYLVYELWQNGIEFEYFNIGKGSAGNHVIFHRYKQKVKELLEKGVNPNNIYCTLQLSGLVRSTHPVYEIEFDLPNVTGAEWDYIDNLNPTVNLYKDVLEAHISNLENIIQWNKDNGIIHFNMFFGWAIFFEDELIQYNLKERFELIDKNYFTYFDYKESVDVMRYNCAGVKQVIKTIFGLNEKYIIQSGKYGGMTEFVAARTTNPQQYYISHYDAHLNTYGNYKWYAEYFRKLYIKWGILSETNSIEENQKLNRTLHTIFEVNTDCFMDSYQYTQEYSDNNELKLRIRDEKYNKFFKNLL